MNSAFDGTELEMLYPATYEGIAVGDRVKIASDLADDVKRGNIAIVTGLDTHPKYPVTVTVHKLKGNDIHNLPVGLDEIVLDA